MLRPRVLLVGMALLTTLGACGASTGLVTPPTPDVPEDRPVSTPTREAFERCVVNDVCPGATACIPVSLSTNGQPGRLCSLTCTSPAACPTRGVHSNFPVSCAIVGTSGLGHCYESCDTDAQCGPGTRCTTLPTGPLPVCVPIQ